jgi:hypothetical protein
MNFGQNFGETLDRNPGENVDRGAHSIGLYIAATVSA